MLLSSYPLPSYYVCLDIYLTYLCPRMMYVRMSLDSCQQLLDNLIVRTLGAMTLARLMPREAEPLAHLRHKLRVRTRYSIPLCPLAYVPTATHFYALRRGEPSLCANGAIITMERSDCHSLENPMTGVVCSSHGSFATNRVLCTFQAPVAAGSGILV